MLTRLKVNGFKSLVDVDVRFGPFTCIAGANGTGKSNLFDAIHFLSALADRPLVDAALSVRDAAGRSGDVRRLFHQVGQVRDETMSFEAEMIIPAEGRDDLGQIAKATTTFVRYTLEVGYRQNGDRVGPGLLEIRKEELTHLRRGDDSRNLPFHHVASTWRKTAVKGRRTTPFISTEDKGSHRIIKQHQDGGRSGRSLAISAADLPRTVLSTANAAEAPTATLARREMQSWRLLQLEPSSLRRPDSFISPSSLASDGSHLASTLYRLAGTDAASSPEPDAKAAQVYAQVANRLLELIDEVSDVHVDRDEKRELLTVYVTDRDRTPHPAMSLSDGTLRFLALAVLELDPECRGLICLEEPENGIHPERIGAMLRLLQDIATDPEEPVGPDNPLRQVIINTHSPTVVGLVPEASLLVAELKEVVRAGKRFKAARFSTLPDTWREVAGDGQAHVVSKGKLLAYLNPFEPAYDLGDAAKGRRRGRRPRKSRRVIDLAEFQPYLPTLQGVR